MAHPKTMAHPREKEILKQVRQVEYQVRRLVSGVRFGVKASPFKGQGMTFSDIRHYDPGDDIRSFAWQVMAKTGEPHVKQFEEERDLEVHVAIDVGQTMSFGGLYESKFDVSAYLLAFIGLATQKSRDKFGGVVFSDHVLERFSTLRGDDNVRRFLYSLLTHEPKPRVNAKLDSALNYFSKLKSKNNICFLISDFSTPLNKKLFAQVRSRHPLHLVHVYDPYEIDFPKMGWVDFLTPESEDPWTVKTNSFFSSQIKSSFLNKKSELERLSKGHGSYLVSQSTHDIKLNEMTKLLKLGRLHG